MWLLHAHLDCIKDKLPILLRNAGHLTEANRGRSWSVSGWNVRNPSKRGWPSGRLATLSWYSVDSSYRIYKRAMPFTKERVGERRYSAHEMFRFSKQCRQGYRQTAITKRGIPKSRGNLVSIVCNRDLISMRFSLSAREKNIFAPKVPNHPPVRRHDFGTILYRLQYELYN